MTDLTRDPAYPERPYPEVTRGGGVPHVEVLSRGPASPSVRTPLRRSARFKIFSAVFLLVLAAGSLWNFTRPAVYRATATVLVEAPEGIGFRAGEDGHDLQNVAVQGRVLLAQELLQDTLARAGASGGAVPLDPDGLRTLLSVRPTPDTNLVELDATGGDPELLARLVNAWTEAYLALRQRQVATDVDESLTRLQEEYDRLDASKREKAEALDAYRERHEIATMERDGNSALARLNALTESLNKARAEALEAESRYAALEEAIARGEPVVPQSEQGELMSLERQAAELRLKLEGLAKRYTPMYMQNSPNLRELPAELADLDQRIERMKTEGREFQRSVVRRDIERTRRQVELQEQQMRVAREEASRFTARYARYETMKQDLEAVDDLHRELEARLVDVKTKAPERYQQVEVVEPAFPPQRPIQPDYWRDLAYTLAGAGASALLAVLLMEFLGRRTRDEDEELPLTGVRVFPGASGTATAPALAVATPGPSIAHQAPGALSAEEVPSLPSAIQRELLVGEVRALTELADPASAQLIGLILAGLTTGECAALGPDDLDLETGTLRVPGQGRELVLEPALLERLRAHRPLPLWHEAPAVNGVEGLAARIGLLAHDAGISHPAEIGIGSLRHTYICWLVRQGARLTEIERIIGPVPAAELSRYAVFRPSGPAKPLDDLDLAYPAFAGSA